MGEEEEGGKGNVRNKIFPVNFPFFLSDSFLNHSSAFSLFNVFKKGGRENPEEKHFPPFRLFFQRLCDSRP